MKPFKNLILYLFSVAYEKLKGGKYGSVIDWSLIRIHVKGKLSSQEAEWKCNKRLSFLFSAFYSQ